MEEFKKYYKFPLKPMLGLEQLKVLTDDNKMAFDWCQDLDPQLRSNLIAKINMESEFKFKTLYDKGNNVIYFGPFFQTPLLHIRGWGMLTDNPNHLPEDEARKIRDEFGEFICKQLNS